MFMGVYVLRVAFVNIFLEITVHKAVTKNIGTQDRTALEKPSLRLM